MSIAACKTNNTHLNGYKIRFYHLTVCSMFNVHVRFFFMTMTFPLAHVIKSNQKLNTVSNTQKHSQSHTHTHRHTQRAKNFFRLRMRKHIFNSPNNSTYELICTQNTLFAGCKNEQENENNRQTMILILIWNSISFSCLQFSVISFEWYTIWEKSMMTIFDMYTYMKHMYKFIDWAPQKLHHTWRINSKKWINLMKLK